MASMMDDENDDYDQDEDWWWTILYWWDMRITMMTIIVLMSCLLFFIPAQLYCHDQEGDIRILVSTNALEEGINVAECTWVVRFDKILGLVHVHQPRPSKYKRHALGVLLQNQSIWGHTHPVVYWKMSKKFLLSRLRMAFCWLFIATRPTSFTVMMFWLIQLHLSLDGPP